MKTPHQSQTRSYGFSLPAICLAALAIVPLKVFATPLPLTDDGVLTLQNLAGTLVGVTTIPPCINWGGGGSCVAGTTHPTSVTGASNLFLVPSTATIQDLLDPQPAKVTNFEMVSGAGALLGQTIHFDLTQIELPNGGAGFGNCSSNAANNVCSAPNSPFTFMEDSSGTQVTISFDVRMNAYTGDSATFTAYTGEFQAKESGAIVGQGACNGLTANITNILICEAAGGTIKTTWMATEAAATPEPVSFVQLALGLGAIAMSGLRIRHQCKDLPTV